jgi:NADP-dependent 3-hydroxy acid dehydrogenase YdfG
MRYPASILITGAGRGLGAALAMEYALPGVHLNLLDRKPEDLQRTRRQCEGRGAIVSTGIVDVTHRREMDAWIVVSDRRRPLERVIANAGISHGNAVREETDEEARAEKAARIIRRKLQRNVPEVVFPFPYSILAKFLSLVPAGLMARATVLR